MSLTKNDRQFISQIYLDVREENKSFRKEMKEENKSFRKEMREENKSFREEMRQVVKELRNDILKFKDQILQEITDLRDDIAVTIGYSDKLEDHEQRIKKLEKEKYRRVTV